MSKRGLLLIDGSNIGHAANSAQKLSVGDQPTQAVFGVLRTLRPMISVYSMLIPVVLWDGASWRRMTFPEYKANRDKVAKTKHEVEQQKNREEFRSQIPLIKEALTLLGVKQMSAINYEADDLAGLFVKRLAETKQRGVLMSADKDWVQLIEPNIAWVDPIRDYRLTYKTLGEKLGYNPARKQIECNNHGKRDVQGWTGVPSPAAWLEMKAMMGDTSDNIPGVGGIGERGALDFVCAYGSHGAFMNQIVDKTIDVNALPKKLRDFADSDEKQEIFRRNMRLMDLRSTDRPDPISLKQTQQAIDPVGFEKFCRGLMFNSILSDLNGWLEPFTPQMDLAA